MNEAAALLIGLCLQSCIYIGGIFKMKGMGRSAFNTAVFLFVFCRVAVDMVSAFPCFPLTS